jgi:hypothetical protein
VPLWRPRYTLTPAITRALMEIESARAVVEHVARTERIAAADVSAALGLSQRMARVLLNDWVEAGWLEVEDPSRRARSYKLSAAYRQFIGSLTAMPDE